VIKLFEESVESNISHFGNAPLIKDQRLLVMNAFAFKFERKRGKQRVNSGVEKLSI
jgi:hypothetical protein